MAVEVYFHVGTGKTGSSAIQGFFNINRKVLFHKYNILYPSKDFPLDDGDFFNHNFVFSEEYKSASQMEVYVKKCLDFANKNKVNQVFFSWENPTETFAKTIANLSQKLNFTPTIIIFFRRQDHYIESAWKQWGHKSKEYKSIEDYAKKLNVNWHEMLLLWKKCLPKAKFIVKPYEKNQMPHGSVNGILNIFNLTEQAEGLIDPDRDYKNRNVGFKKEVIKVLEAAKRLNNNIHDNKLFRFFYENLPKTYLKSPFETYNFFTPQQRSEILQAYQESNNKIAEEFLPQNKGVLFFDEEIPNLSQEETLTQSDLNIEETVPILMGLIASQNNNIKRLNLLMNQLKENLGTTIFTLAESETFVIANKLERKRVRFLELSSIKINGNTSLILSLKDSFTGTFNVLINFNSSQSGKFTLYLSTNEKQEFIEKNAIKLNINQGQNNFIIPIQAATISSKIRMDFTMAKGQIVFNKFKLNKI